MTKMPRRKDVFLFKNLAKYNQMGIFFSFGPKLAHFMIKITLALTYHQPFILSFLTALHISEFEKYENSAI
jgi:hypothetical protein